MVHKTPQEAVEKGLRVWHARRTKSVEALLGEGGLETAQRFVNIEDDCLRASSAVIGGTASPARSTTTPSKRACGSRNGGVMELKFV